MSTRTDFFIDDVMRSRDALTASAPVDLEIPHQRPGLSRSPSARSKPPCPIHGDRSRCPRIRPSERYEQVLDLVYRLRALTDRQIQTALFSGGNASGCQRTLTRLICHRWLGRLEPASVIEPCVYLLTPSSTVGNRLMKHRHGENDFRRRTYRLGSLHHLLGVNEVRVRVERGVRDLGWSLRRWLEPEDLVLLLRDRQLIPDGYFEIARPVNGEIRTSGYFIELEHSSKSSKVLEGKLRAYGNLFQSGAFRELFGIRGMRVLVVFSPYPGSVPVNRVDKAVQQAAMLGVTLAHCTTLQMLRSTQPTEIFSAPLWSHPKDDVPIALLTNPEGGPTP